MHTFLSLVDKTEITYLINEARRHCQSEYMKLSQRDREKIEEGKT